jgi:retron-type reverse transcriptase
VQAQHAFRRGKGTETALSEAVDKIESGILTKKYALGVILDISGAFNSLSFNAATNAMRRQGLPEHITKWYEHFLHHQVSTYELAGKFYTRELKTGCPQGGCLSPLIWNVNFDPILKKLNKGPVKVIGFADDALFIITGHVPGIMVRRMQPYINKIVAWGKRSGLEFNSSKTMAVLFTSKMPKDN